MSEGQTRTAIPWEQTAKVNGPWRVWVEESLWSVESVCGGESMWRGVCLCVGESVVCGEYMWRRVYEEESRFGGEYICV